MHRSGTSLVTRLVNLLGVSLGPEDHLMAPTRFNPKGFWEHQAITDLNDDLLERFGGRWSAPPPLPEGWETDPELDDLRDRAGSIVDADFGDVPLWGWKDPRTCLTLPFWRTVVEPTHYVICVRNPISVAKSLSHVMPLTAGVALWLEYLTLAFLHTAGAPRILVLYDELMNDPRMQTHRLAAFLRRRAEERRPALDALNELVTDELWHHRVSLKQVINHRDLEVSVKSLYVTLYTELSGAGRMGALSRQGIVQAFSEQARAARQTVAPDRSGRATRRRDRAGT